MAERINKDKNHFFERTEDINTHLSKIDQNKKKVINTKIEPAQRGQSST